jgi:hypothetical protein
LLRLRAVSRPEPDVDHFGEGTLIIANGTPMKAQAAFTISTLRLAMISVPGLSLGPTGCIRVPITDIHESSVADFPGWPSLSYGLVPIGVH